MTSQLLLTHKVESIFEYVFLIVNNLFTKPGQPIDIVSDNDLF